MKKHTAIRNLLQKYKEGNCSIEESVLLQQQLEKIVAQERKRQTTIRLMPWLQRGAAILLACVGGAWYYQNNRMAAMPVSTMMRQDSASPNLSSGGRYMYQSRKATPQAKYTLFIGEQ